MIIGIDTGYGYTKTKNTSFPSGVAHLSDRPPMMHRVVEFEGKYYQVGVGTDGITQDKTADEDYYILTLAGIAEEMRLAGLNNVEVVLAVGVPLMRYGAERDALAAYLSKNREITWNYEDRKYHCTIAKKVYVFPQGYSAIVSKLDNIKGSCYLVDMGTGTTEILPILADKTVDLGHAKTVQYGISNCISAVNARISNEFNSTLLEDAIIQVMLGNTADAGIPPRALAICKDAIREFANETLKMLRQNKVNYELQQTFFVGGGAGLVERYADIKKDDTCITFIKDIKVNAAGYELLAAKAQEKQYKTA